MRAVDCGVGETRVILSIGREGMGGGMGGLR